jgi:hypothetical protein
MESAEEASWIAVDFFSRLQRMIAMESDDFHIPSLPLGTPFLTFR